MKTNQFKNQNAGSVLLVTLVITGLLGFTLASYLTMIGTQNRSVARSQNWNASVPIAEAGIEEAMMHLNKNCLWSDVTRAPVNWNADGWVTVAEGYRMTRWLGENRYTVTIVTASPHSEMHPAILSEGYVPALLTKSTPDTLFAAVGTETETQTRYVARKVKVLTSKDGLMTGAMVAKDSIDFKGNGIRTDSFDSEDPAYSTAGRFDPAKVRDNGDVAVNYGIINSLNIGNADILGSVAVGPGGSIAIGPNGHVGDAAWHASNTGIQPGRSRDDMNVSFPDVEDPFRNGETYSVPTGDTVTNEVITAINITNFSLSFPTNAGTVYTNTTSTTTASYPTSGTYIGSVTTNTTYTNTVAFPSSGTYLGIVATNTYSVTSTNPPVSGTYIGSVITNTAVFTTSTFPTSFYGEVRTNWHNNGKWITGYTYRKITGYTVEKIGGYGYRKISGYTVASITGYTLVQSTYTTNLVAKYYDYVLGDGNYKIGALDGEVLVLGNAVLYVTDDLDMESVHINSNARLKLYMGGESASINGNTFINASGNADNFWYFGLPTHTDLSFTGNGGFCGVIYAPQADFHLGGGGADRFDFIGSSLTKTVQMNGHFNFHYDESLARKGASRGYLINSWDEVRLDETE